MYAIKGLCGLSMFFVRVVRWIMGAGWREKAPHFVPVKNINIRSKLTVMVRTIPA